MGIKTLGTVIGHVSSATTLNTYSHVTDEMRQRAAVKIDLGIAKAEVTEQEEKSKERTGVETYAPFSNRKSYGILAKRCESSAIHETAFIPGISCNRDFVLQLMEHCVRNWLNLIHMLAVVTDDLS